MMFETNYDDYCHPIKDKEIDQLTREIYNSYGEPHTLNSPAVKIHHMLRDYFIDKYRYKSLITWCYTVLEKEGEEQWLVITNCQNSVFKMNKINDLPFNEIKDHPEIGEEICESNFNEYDWVFYLYKNKYPREDILNLLLQTKEIIKNTPKEDLGEED